MKVILINPPAEQVVEPWDNPDFPHLGLAYLAAFIRKKGISVSVIDAKFERLTSEQVIEKVKRFSPDIIGVTAMTNYVKASANIVKALRELFPTATFLIGGAHPTALPAQTLKEFVDFDIAVIGEAEEALFEIIESKPGQWNSISGIAYRRSDAIILNNPRKAIEDLDSLPFPAWDIFPAAKTYPIITSRGCPFRCVFCMRMLGNKIRLRSSENVLQELKLLQDKYKTRHIPILDEIFTISRERIYDVCNLMVKAGLDKRLTWGANARVTGVSYEIFTKMYEAGCRKIDFGIESGNDEVLKLIKKDTKVEDAVRAVGWAKKARIKTHGLFILGHPDETRQTAEDTINLAVRLNTTFVSVGIMVPYPGTEVYNMAKAGLGGYRIISENWNDYNKQIGNALELKGLDRKALEKLQIIAYLKFYLYNFRIIELFSFIFAYRKAAFFYIKSKIWR